MFRSKKAQSTAEYVIVLGLVVGVVIAMQTYIKRGLQGRVKEAVDFTDQGGQTVATDVVQFSGNQYEPYYLESSFNSNRSSNENENLQTGGSVVKTLTSESSDRTGTQTIKLGTAAND
jgi:hypothetical protein